VGYLVSIEDVTPPARADERPWTAATLSEGAEIGGPWTEIADFVISPVDSDPARPQPRAFSTDQALLTQGWYRLVFRDDADGTYEMNPVSLFPKIFAPTVADVAMLILARTVDDSGERRGTFTPDTTPTSTEVQQFIVKAVATVSAVAVVTIDSEPQLILQARNLAALYAAMLVELSYRPGESDPEDSAYDRLLELYEKGLAALISALPDSNATRSGFYSLRTRSDVAGVFSTAELLP
jgi:hypothetical protein